MSTDKLPTMANPIPADAGHDVRGSGEMRSRHRGRPTL